MTENDLDIIIRAVTAYCGYQEIANRKTDYKALRLQQSLLDASRELKTHERVLLEFRRELSLANIGVRR